MAGVGGLSVRLLIRPPTVHTGCACKQLSPTKTPSPSGTFPRCQGRLRNKGQQGMRVSPTVNWRANVEFADQPLQNHSNLSGSKLALDSRSYAAFCLLPSVQNTCECVTFYQHQPGPSFGRRGPLLEARWLQIKGPQINGLTADNLRHRRPPDIGDSGPSREHRGTSLCMSHSQCLTPPQDPCQMSKLLPGSLPGSLPLPCPNTA